MSNQHKAASAIVAQVLFDQMAANEQAVVRAEAVSKGVSAVEIVRRSLDILIAEAGSPAAKGRNIET
ncbi:hypothetical protein [Methylobacterium marchantiae]|uniref:CopG family transcriptional regulator n=1 Tax=Methylobacterium marchantiae TaxID=600331 RepID=A0ABW3WZ70_9HYPH|nr:hypothetical protein AIGOOFII_1632 [Methylobacterium marchantiae]